MENVQRIELVDSPAHARTVVMGNGKLRRAWFPRVLFAHVPPYPVLLVADILNDSKSEPKQEQFSFFGTKQEQFFARRSDFHFTAVPLDFKGLVLGISWLPNLSLAYGEPWSSVCFGETHVPVAFDIERRINLFWNTTFHGHALVGSAQSYRRRFARRRFAVGTKCGTPIAPALDNMVVNLRLKHGEMT